MQDNDFSQKSSRNSRKNVGNGSKTFHPKGKMKHAESGGRTGNRTHQQAIIGMAEDMMMEMYGED